MEYLHALSGVFSLLLVCLVGVVLDRAGWVGPEVRRLVPKFVTCIALPPYLFCAIVTTFGHEDVRDFLLGSLVPIASILLTFATALALAKVFHVKQQRFGLFCASFSCSSAVFVGIPMCGALLGPKSIPYALLYYFANAAFFWTIGSYLIAADANRQSPFSARRAIRVILSPPFLGFTAGLGAALLNVNMPSWFMNAASTIGQLTTPLALLYIGFSLSIVPKGRALFSKDLMLACAGRLLVCPLVTLLVVLAFSIDEFVGKVFVLQAALPAVMQASILSAHYKTDPAFGTLVITTTTIGCVLTLPLVMALF